MKAKEALMRYGSMGGYNMMSQGITNWDKFAEEPVRDTLFWKEFSD